MHTESLLVEGERLQTQELGEVTNITLAIDYGTISFDLERLREPATDRVGFVHDDDPRMPDLVEPVVCNSTTGCEADESLSIAKRWQRQP